MWEESVIEVHHLVAAGVYESEEEALQDALRCLLRSRPDLRVQLAVHRYQHEGLSLSKAASIAGVSWAQMRQVLVERGVQPHLGPESLEEAQEEVRALKDAFRDDR